MKVIQKKVCLLGDFAVGKTSLIRRFVEGTFDDKYLSTIGVKISRKPLQRDNYVLNMLVWDLAGGDDFSKMESSYLRGASAALIVCDLTRPETVPALTHYLEQMRRFNPDAALIFAGNKADLVEEQRVDSAELANLSTQWNVPLFMTSAKTGQHVEDCFEQLACQIENSYSNDV